MAGTNRGSIVATYRDKAGTQYIVRAARMSGLFTLHHASGKVDHAMTEARLHAWADRVGATKHTPIAPEEGDAMRPLGVGDAVRITRDHSVYHGKIGTIFDTRSKAGMPLYCVSVEGMSGCALVRAEEIERPTHTSNPSDSS